MERIDENQELIIERLQDHIMEMDPGDPNYGKMLGRLESMLRQRDTAYRNEMDAVENDRRLEFDKEKLEKETELGKQKVKTDKRRNIVEVGKTVIGCATSAVLVVLGMKMEYDEHNPISVPNKVINWIPKIK